jgi:hypothetical protein
MQETAEILPSVLRNMKMAGLSNEGMFDGVYRISVHTRLEVAQEGKSWVHLTLIRVSSAS